MLLDPPIVFVFHEFYYWRHKCQLRLKLYRSQNFYVNLDLNKNTHYTSINYLGLFLSHTTKLLDNIGSYLGKFGIAILNIDDVEIGSKIARY